MFQKKLEQLLMHFSFVLFPTQNIILMEEKTENNHLKRKAWT